MAALRLLALLACLSAQASAQTVPATRPPPIVIPRPPVIAPPPSRVLPPPALVPNRRLVPVPGHPGRFIICPGHRRCPPAH